MTGGAGVVAVGGEQRRVVVAFAAKHRETP